MNGSALSKANISYAQARGIKRRATTDHLLILKCTIKTAKQNKNPVYISFLDVTKAYNKAWLDVILHVMMKNGITESTWKTIKDLSTNLRSRIKTKYGTR